MINGQSGLTNFSDAFLKRTIEVWQPRFKAPLTLEDAREIAVQWTALLKLVIDIHRENTQNPKIQVISNKEG